MNFANFKTDLEQACREINQPYLTEMFCANLRKHSSPELFQESKEHGRTLLQLASGLGNLLMVRCMIDSGALKNEPADTYGDRAIHRAARFNRAEVIGLLAKSGCDVNIPGQDGNTPLHTAGACNSVETFVKLIEFGADPTIPNNYGQSVIEFVETYPRSKGRNSLSLFRDSIDEHSKENSIFTVDLTSPPPKRAKTQTYATADGQAVGNVYELALANFLAAGDFQYEYLDHVFHFDRGFRVKIDLNSGNINHGSDMLLDRESFYDLDESIGAVLRRKFPAK